MKPRALLMMTDESMLSKRSVLRFTATLLFLLQLFSSDVIVLRNKNFLFFFSAKNRIIYLSSTAKEHKMTTDDKKRSLRTCKIQFMVKRYISNLFGEMTK